MPSLRQTTTRNSLLVKLRNIVPPLGSHEDAAVPYFFFDIHDGAWANDGEGVEFADVEAACHEVKRLLPGMAVDHMLQDGDRHAITVLVTDEDRRPIYTATLSFAGLVLKG